MKTVILDDEQKSYPAKSASSQIIKLLLSKEVLATHSLTGKKSPAFQDRNPLPAIDPRITEAVFRKFDSLLNFIIFIKLSSKIKI